MSGGKSLARGDGDSHGGSMSDDPNCLHAISPGWACGTDSTARNGGCIGAACDAAKREAARLYRVRRRARIDAGEADVPHGTVSGYTSCGCRCDPCKEARRAYDAAWRTRSRSGVPE